jgi:hypothetical protein
VHILNILLLETMGSYFHLFQCQIFRFLGFRHEAMDPIPLEGLSLYLTVLVHAQAWHPCVSMFSVSKFLWTFVISNVYFFRMGLCLCCRILGIRCFEETAPCLCLSVLEYIINCMHQKSTLTSDFDFSGHSGYQGICQGSPPSIRRRNVRGKGKNQGWSIDSILLRLMIY